jgi:hypothetical protein
VDSSSCVVYASYILYGINSKGENTTFKSAGVKVFETQGQGKIDGWGRDRFICSSLLADENDGFVVDDTVSFSVEITVYGAIDQDPSTFTNESTISQDLRAHFLRGSSFDFTIVIKNSLEQFKCHKLMLEARCPVFQAMFSYNMMERNSRQLIVDEEPLVVQAFIEFLYSDYIR